MTLQKLPVKLIGVSPILLHSGQTADPLNRFAKAMKVISSKRGKTDADFEELAKIEWFASLYTAKESEGGHIVLPDFVVEATLNAGCRKSKLGKQAQAGLFVDGHSKLNFDGDNLSIDKLFERDENRHCAAVRIGQSKVMRTRFIAEQWSTDVMIVFNDTLLNKAQVEQAVFDAGEQCGICDWRPKFGRFTAEIGKLVK